MNAEIKSALQRLSCLVLIAIMLNLSFYPAFAEEMPSTPQTGLDAANGKPEIVNTPKTAEFACGSPETESFPGENVLKPEEVAKLKRLTEVENKGFSIDNINSGKGQNPERDTLENDTIVQKKPDGTAVVSELPNGKIDTGEISQWHNQWFSGGFSFGVSLDDTIRIGQCRNLSALEAEKRGCPLTDIQLSYRNSGEGITTNFKNVWNDIKDWLTPDALAGHKTGQYTPAQLEQTRTNIASQTDPNSLQAKYVKREVKQIPNSVLTEEFEANMATTGSDSGSLISIYSMFDKYFNSWFSTEMVVSTFGPTLFGQAKKYAGWMKRRGWAWDTTDSKFMQWFRSKFYDPEGLLGEARLKRMVTRTDKYGFGEAWTKGIEATGDWDSGYAFMKGGSWRKNMNEWTKPGGYLDEMTDPVQRGEFFKQIEDLRAYAHTNKAIADKAADAYKKAKDAFGEASPQAKAALIDQARTQARLMLAADGDWLRLDATELWVKEECTGLYDKAIKLKGTDNFHTFVGDSKAAGKVQQYYADASKTWDAGDFPFTTQGGMLEIYKVSPKGEFIEEVPVEDLSKNFSRYIDKAAMTEKGDLLKIDSSSIGYIAKESPTGKVKVYKANWELDHLETPELYAKRLTNLRSSRVTQTMPRNVDRMYNTLIEKNFAGQSRRYYSWLDKAFMQDQEILKNYLGTVGGAAKWTLMPYLYWEGKRGFGFEGISAFQLPDTWKSVTLYVDNEKIFDDAFIDIFAQAGSDEGDIFVQVLDKLPWKMALNYVSEKFNPVDNAYKQITTPMSGWRREVENLAYFTSTRTDCATCGTMLVPIVTSQEALAELNDKGRGRAVISFNANQDMKSYFVEDILNENTKEDGTTLIAFGRHTNITGESIDGTGSETEPIDLIEAQKDNETCADAVKDLGLGFLGDDPQRVGAILAFTESAGYFLFFWSGLIGSMLQQTLIIPKLQNCVDDIDGYFVHMFAAYNPEAKGTETPNQTASKNAGGIIQNINDLIKGTKQTQAPAKSTDKYEDAADKPPKDEQGQAYAPKTYTGDKDDRPQYPRPWEAQQTSETKSVWDLVKEKITTEADALSQKAQSKAVLQMDVETKGESNGVAFFEKMFFFWFKGESMVTKYDDKSKYLLEDTDKKLELPVDKEKGTLSVKQAGKPAEEVITSADNLRGLASNLNVPGLPIPQRTGNITLPTGSAFEMFEMDWRGNFIVKDQATLDCIKQNVVEQTGVPLTSKNLTEVFGRVDGIVTDVYPTVTPSFNAASESEKRITANGSPREIAYGENARAIVTSDMKTTMLNGREIDLGKFSAAKFKNGVILYKPATATTPAQLLIWLRTNQQSILKPSDVSGLKATVADIINAETGCPEPAIDLEAIPNLDAGDKSAIAKSVANFNTSMQKMGPFQIFDTDRHRFMFYSKKTSATCNAADAGCCQNRVSIIDKKTGKVYDQAIVGGLEQTPTGVKFTTDDGKEHTLDFSADNGVPKIAYNDMAPETLTMARGPNGAFWYDPDTQTWNPYNAQILPALEAFKTLGALTQHRGDSSVSTQPGSNTMNVQVGGTAENPFNLPSIPADPAAMMLFVLSLIGAICIARAGIERRFKR